MAPHAMKAGYFVIGAIIGAVAFFVTFYPCRYLKRMIQAHQEEARQQRESIIDWEQLSYWQTTMGVTSWRDAGTNTWEDEALTRTSDSVVGPREGEQEEAHQAVTVQEQQFASWDLEGARQRAVSQNQRYDAARARARSDAILHPPRSWSHRRPATVHFESTPIVLQDEASTAGKSGIQKEHASIFGSQKHKSGIEGLAGNAKSGFKNGKGKAKEDTVTNLPEIFRISGNKASIVWIEEGSEFPLRPRSHSWHPRQSTSSVLDPTTTDQGSTNSKKQHRNSAPHTSLAGGESSSTQFVLLSTPASAAGGMFHRRPIPNSTSSEHILRVMQIPGYKKVGTRQKAKDRARALRSLEGGN